MSAHLSPSFPFALWQRVVFINRQILIAFYLSARPADFYLFNARRCIQAYKERKNLGSWIEAAAEKTGK